MNKNHHAQVNWTQFLVPGLFGLVAAFCYWKTLSSQLEPVYFTQVKHDVALGQRIQSSDLAVVALRGDTTSFAAGAVLWEQKATALLSPAARDLRRGQILLKSDLQLEDEVDDPLEGELSSPLDGLDKVAMSDDIRVGALIQATVRSASGSSEFVGPFRVLKLNRNNDRRISSMQIATRPVKTTRGRRPDPEYMRLQAALGTSGSEKDTVVNIEVCDTVSKQTVAQAR